MLTDFLYKYMSNDKDCLLGLIPDANKFAILISPLNANTLYPSTSSISSSYWIKKQNIISDNNVRILSGSFYSDDVNSDWSISTNLNLLGNVEPTGSDFTFSTKIKISTANIGNTIIPLFKQGGTDVNDTLDIHFEFNRNIDSSGSLDKLVINVYYESPVDSSSLNLESFELFDISSLIDTEVQLTVSIDSENSEIKVFANNNLIGSKVMDISKILDLNLNAPQNTSGNINTIVGGSKFIKMKNAFIWKRVIKPAELIFINKIISERIIK